MEQCDEAGILSALAEGDLSVDALKVAREIADVRIRRAELRAENAYLRSRVAEESERVALLYRRRT